MVVAGLATVAGGLVALKGARAAWNIGRGALDLARGTLLAGRSGRAPAAPGLPGKLGNLASVLTGGAAAGAQPVFVTNWPGAGALGFRSAGLGPGRRGRAFRIASRRHGLRRWRFGAGRRRLGKAGGRPGGALAIGSAAYQVFDTAKNATTRSESSGLRRCGRHAGRRLGRCQARCRKSALGGPIGIAIGGRLRRDWFRR